MTGKEVDKRLLPAAELGEVLDVEAGLSEVMSLNPADRRLSQLPAEVLGPKLANWAEQVRQAGNQSATENGEQ